MRFKIVGYEPKIEEPTNYFIEYWYDRQLRLWTIQVLTDTDVPVDVESRYAVKDVLKSTIEDLSAEYNTTDIRKV